MLADAGHVHRVRPDELADPLDDVLRGQAAVFWLVVAQRVLGAPRVEQCPPVGVVAHAAARVLGLDGGDQLGDDFLAVADDRHVRAAVLGDLGRVDVRVHDPRPGRERVQLPGYPVIEPRAQGDEQVGLLQRADRRDGPVHAGHAQVLRVAVRERAARHQRGDHGGAGELGELEQLRRGVRPDHAAAHVQHRLLGLGDHPCGLPDLPGVRPGHRVVAGQVERDWPGELGGGLQRVLGDVDEHRARPAGGGQVEGLADGAGDVPGLGDEEVVLGHRQRDPGYVRFLEPVGADQVRGHLTGDRHHGDAVHVGVGERGDQVGRAWAARRHADANPAGCLGVPGRRVPGTLLVADQDVPDLLGVKQWVVRGQDGPAGNAEHHLHADLLKGEDERLGAGHLRLDLLVLLVVGCRGLSRCGALRRRSRGVAVRRPCRDV